MINVKRKPWILAGLISLSIFFGGIIFGFCILYSVNQYKLKTIKINSQKHVIWVGIDGVSGNAVKASNDKNFKLLESHSIYNLAGKRTSWTAIGKNFMSTGLGREISILDWLGFDAISKTSMINTLDRSDYSTAIFESKERMYYYLGAGKNTHVKIYDDSKINLHETDVVTRTKGMEYFMKFKPNFEMIYMQDVDNVGHNNNGWGKEYISSIHELGVQLNEIINTLKSDPILAANTLVFIAADHGFDKGNPYHGGVNNSNTINVPIYYWNINYKSQIATPYQSKIWNARWEWEKWLQSK